MGLERDVCDWDGLKHYIIEDFRKINPRGNWFEMLRSFVLEPGFKYCVYLRLTRFLFLRGGGVRFLLFRFRLKHLQYKYGFDISYRTRIGPGLSISHFGSIIVAAESIGKGCSLRPGVVIGSNLVKNGNPQIGDYVEFGVGSKVLGKIVIGDHVIIGANAVVVKNVPDNSIAVGIPATNKMRYKNDS